LPGNDE
jgi:hydrocephalus-inducing protein